MTTPAPHPARDRLVLVLDVDDWDTAAALMTRLRPWFATVKVGLELYAAVGPDAIARARDLDVEVFADLKLHDIPTQVGRAARVLGRRGVSFLNFHTTGGVDMLRAGAEGLREGAAEAGMPPPSALGVTVLTSEADTAAFGDRLGAAVDAGCDGVVCSAFEVDAARAHGLRTMVPGVRFAGTDRQDQVRVTTPGDAAARGADWLVIGRAVTGAADVEAAAARVADEVSTAGR